ncbi:MAG: hypothetical protein H6733_10215 [Alphaproteobacteria bacterium]|nr:hypothetical protein [Alphaproteobacteria bacterium]
MVKASIAGQEFEIDPVVTLGGRPVVLTPPRSMALRYTVVAPMSDNRMLGVAACLGLCWMGNGHPRTNLKECKYDAYLYGARVIDELTDRGMSIEEILAAGDTAFALVADGLVAATEVEETEDFTGPPVEA